MRWIRILFNVLCTVSLFSKEAAIEGYLIARSLGSLANDGKNIRDKLGTPLAHC